jgi:hypothetical protein
MEYTDRTKRGSRWSLEEDRILEQMWRAGSTDRQIGAAVGRSYKAVEGRRTALGMVPDSRPPMEDELEEVQAETAKPKVSRVDLFAKWDAWNIRLRERLMAEKAYPFDGNSSQPV